MYVNAANQFTVNQSFSFTYTLANGNWSSGGGASGYINNGTGSITASPTFSGQNGLTVHVKQPFHVQSSWSGNWSPETIFTLFQRYSNFSSSGCTVTSIGLYSSDGVLLASKPDNSTTSYLPCTEIALLDSGYNWGFNKLYYFEYDLTVNNTITSSGSSSNYNQQCSVSFNMIVDVRPSTQQEIESSKESVNDSGTQSRLDTQINQETTAQTTRTGILNQLTSFFGSFFENIINSFKSLFIPEDGYFTRAT